MGIATILIIGLITGLNAQLPTITTQPRDGYAAKDKPYTLGCNSESTSDTIIWYKNGQPILTQYQDPQSLYVLITTGDLFFLKFRTQDVGWYYCNVTNSFGSKISSNATLQIPEIADVFQIVPEPTTVVLTRTVTLSCQAPVGTPLPQVQWLKNNSRLDIDSESRYRLESPGNLIIRDARRTDEAFYVCLARNEAGERITAPAFLSVLEPPVITKSPIDLFVNEKGIARFHCEASGDPVPNITWVKTDDNLDSRRTSVQSDNSLVIRDINPSDEGSYSCIVMNAGGRAQALADLTVYTAPVFLQEPTSKTVGKGTDVSFRCVVSGNPPPVFSWSKIQGDLLQLYARQSKGRFSVVEDGTLHITDIQASDEGEYRCFASNSAGSNTTSASLRVQDEGDSRPPPVITDRPQNTTIPLTEEVELECKASGNPSPTIRWTHNRRPVLADSRISINRGNLRITDIRVTDSGEYTCLAISESGDASASAFLSIIGIRESDIETLLPAAPERPAVSADDITETSVRLYWGANGDESKVIFYSVDVFTRQNKEGWVTKVPSTTQTSSLIQNLLPGASYLMLVRAHNSHGMSEPSPVSDYVTTLVGEGDNSVDNGWSRPEIENNLNGTRVVLQQVNILSATALNITWKLPNQYRSYVEGFYVRVATSGVPSTSRVVYGSLSNYHIITKLTPFTQYTVTVTPFYHDYSGIPSSVQRALTQEDVPGPPSDVRVQEGERITVSWLPPKVSQRNGIIRGYVIICQAADTRLSRNFSVNATVMNVVLQNLNRDTDYRIGVAAVTTRGTGVPSHMSNIEAKVVVEPVDKSWWLHALIGSLGGLVWVVLCILIICLCRRRCALRKAKKQNPLTVSLQNSGGPEDLMIQYQLDATHRLATLQRMNHMNHQLPQVPPGPYSPDQQDFGAACIHNINDNNYDDPMMKTFYNKKTDSMSTGPYATTVLLRPHADNQGINDMGETTLGSCDSSCTDNNGTGGMQAIDYGDRGSPPQLPSFSDMILPPPPLCPPPSSAANTTGMETTNQPLPSTTSMPRMGMPHCNTCSRGFHPAVNSPRAHFKIDAMGRPYNPTMPNMHSFPSNHQLRGQGGEEYHSVCPPDMRSQCNHPYHVCYPHSAGSDSHHYAEPSLTYRTYNQPPPPQQGNEAHHPEPITPFAHQMVPPPHLLHLYTPTGQNLQPYDPHKHHHTHDKRLASDGHMSGHHSLPMSDHELCLSCAEQTEYEEPWSNQMPNWPLHWHPSQHPHIAEQQQQLTPNHQQGENGEEANEETAMLSEKDDSLLNSNHTVHSAPSIHSAHSGSEDSKSGQNRRSRRQRPQRDLSAGNRSGSPYNGYSTDSSVVFVPRKPYQKSQRKKRNGSRPKPSTKSLAVQVEQEDKQQDKV